MKINFIEVVENVKMLPWDCIKKIIYRAVAADVLKQKKFNLIIY